LCCCRTRYQHKLGLSLVCRTSFISPPSKEMSATSSTTTTERKSRLGMVLSLLVNNFKKDKTEAKTTKADETKEEKQETEQTEQTLAVQRLTSEVEVISSEPSPCPGGKEAEAEMVLEFNGDAESVLAIFSDEILYLILSWVPIKDLASANLVCRRWNAYISQESFWCMLVERVNGRVDKPANRSWQWVYRSKNITVPNKETFAGVARSVESHYVYEGEWKAGKMDGFGIQLFKTGAVYVGEFVAGERKGKGKHTWLLGDVYEGDWNYGQPHGRGTKKWPGGDVYEGEWELGHRKGHGVYTWPSGHRYEGGWKDKLQDGHGVYSWKDGRVYDGGWKDGEKDGQGTYKWPNGCLYVGAWKAGRRHGQGTMRWEDGSSYSGRWEDDRRSMNPDHGVYSGANGQQLGQPFPWGSKTFDDYFALDDEAWELKYGQSQY
jgi:hypothetical protein